MAPIGSKFAEGWIGQPATSFSFLIMAPEKENQWDYPVSYWRAGFLAKFSANETTLFFAIDNLGGIWMDDERTSHNLTLLPGDLVRLMLSGDMMKIVVESKEEEVSRVIMRDLPVLYDPQPFIYLWPEQRLEISDGWELLTRDRGLGFQLHLSVLRGETKELYEDPSCWMVKDFKGRTPIWYLASMGRKELIDRLIKYSDQGEELFASAVNIADDDGETPLHAIARYGKDSMVSFLLRRGAQWWHKNKKGETARDIAERTDYFTGLSLRTHEERVKRISIALQQTGLSLEDSEVAKAACTITFILEDRSPLYTEKGNRLVTAYRLLSLILKSQKEKRPIRKENNGSTTASRSAISHALHLLLLHSGK